MSFPLAGPEGECEPEEAWRGTKALYWASHHLGPSYQYFMIDSKPWTRLITEPLGTGLKPEAWGTSQSRTLRADCERGSVFSRSTPCPLSEWGECSVEGKGLHKS